MEPALFVMSQAIQEIDTIGVLGAADDASRADDKPREVSRSSSCLVHYTNHALLHIFTLIRVSMACHKAHINENGGD